MDVVSSVKRSEMMSGIRGRNTRPELQVRAYLHARGLRFRLHRKDLPGRPDVVLPKYRVAVFVHGCFWHRHPGCKFTTEPATREDFWRQKFAANVSRDLRNTGGFASGGLAGAGHLGVWAQKQVKPRARPAVDQGGPRRDAGLAPHDFVRPSLLNTRARRTNVPA